MVRQSDHFHLGHFEGKNEQLHLPLVNRPTKHVDYLRHGAREYAKSQGLTYSHEGLDDMQADPIFQSKVGRHYENAQSRPDDHRVKSAYTALRHEVAKQYDYLTRPPEHGGLGVQVEYHPEDYTKPLYPSHRELIDDLQTNRRIKVSKTGVNEGDTASAHPFFSTDENDMFRAVHDAFGHAAIGRSFTRHGEEAAYHSHAQMFSPAARPALASETRSQNSALNYGTTGGFPEQKAVVPPPWALRDRRGKGRLK